MRTLFGGQDVFGADETDPGKDLFALLFISFLILGTIVLSGVSQGEKRTPLKANAAGGKMIIEKKYLARLAPCGGTLCLEQAGKRFRLPDEAQRVAREALFPPESKERVLVILPPGPGVGAADLLTAVSALNQAGLRVEFRAPAKK